MPEDYSSSELIRYLLRELPEDQVDELEQRYFTNEDSFDELRRVEAELIDSYVAGELDSDQKKKFEQLYLSMPEGKSRVIFGIQEMERCSTIGRSTSSFCYCWRMDGLGVAPSARRKSIGAEKDSRVAEDIG